MIHNEVRESICTIEIGGWGSYNGPLYHPTNLLLLSTLSQDTFGQTKTVYYHHIFLQKKTITPTYIYIRPDT